MRPIHKETQLVLLLQKRNRIRRKLCFICAMCSVVAVIWSIFCLLTGFAYTIPIFLAAAIVLLAVIKFPAGWRYCIQKNWNGPKNFAGIFFFYLILFLVSFLIGPVLFFSRFIQAAAKQRSWLLRHNFSKIQPCIQKHTVFLSSVWWTAFPNRLAMTKFPQ